MTIPEAGQDFATMNTSALIVIDPLPMVHTASMTRFSTDPVVVTHGRLTFLR